MKGRIMCCRECRQWGISQKPVFRHYKRRKAIHHFVRNDEMRQYSVDATLPCYLQFYEWQPHSFSRQDYVELRFRTFEMDGVFL
jgi:hypothetical protein